MCFAAEESIWLPRLHADLVNRNPPKAIVLDVDNNGAIDTAKNLSINERNMHIDIHSHFVQEADKSINDLKWNAKVPRGRSANSSETSMTITIILLSQLAVNVRTIVIRYVQFAG